jgi:hypothetical protein
MADALPNDLSAAHAMIRELTSKLEHRDVEVARLIAMLRKLQRRQFGQRSEQLHPDQLRWASMILRPPLVLPKPRPKRAIPSSRRSATKRAAVSAVRLRRTSPGSSRSSTSPTRPAPAAAARYM